MKIPVKQKPNQTTLIHRLLGLVVSDNEQLGPAVTIIIMTTMIEHEGLVSKKARPTLFFPGK